MRIASFDFTESRILAELYAQSLEGAGVPVRRVGPLASREILQPALEQDVVDLVPEYTGSALEFVNRRAGRATADASTNHELLRQALAARDLDVLAMAPAQNQNAVAVTSSTANRLALTKVSDLVPHARGLVFGGAPECAERPFCLGGLQSLYGLRFKAVRVLDASGPATVGALEGNEVDVALLFTTNPHVGPKRFVLLADDLGLQPADNVVPVLRRAAIERWGDRLPAVLDAVSVALSTAELSHLNASVDLHGRSEADVARDWLRHHGLAGR
ncbi:MAG: L-proline glycine betaine binding ABC transporter protein ProX [uncultured Acidimicrobiales bacterium]|uniref:L-proline glycine betaine binding ABC transporter protein ProX n=1 Tax=uncultured Acidimicrobiales bacterium TaxID=310071 RepID=A0A6J4I2V7_9ACTN|nr:MAG: L-proline glycine betaine binding ABC transporter protein ProX [uncultured Acidimicrobiales bacterium]